MEREFIDVNERCFITVTSAMDYRPWVPYENAMLYLTPSGGTVTTTNNKMFRRVNKYSSVYFLSMDSVTHKNFISHIGLAKSKMVDDPTTNTMHGI